MGSSAAAIGDGWLLAPVSGALADWRWRRRCFVTLAALVELPLRMRTRWLRRLARMFLILRVVLLFLRRRLVLYDEWG